MGVRRNGIVVAFAAGLLSAGASARAQDGGTPPTAAPEARAIDARALRSLHMDLLGRPPLAAEVAARSTRPYEAVVDEVLDAPEFWDRWFEEQLYYFLLVNNFRPQAERVLAIPAELREGKLDVRTAIHRLALSTSFDQRNPGADTFVTVVMEQLLGLEVQKNARELEIGKRVYEGTQGTFLGVAGNCQADVVRNAVENKAFARHYLQREHERIVHSRPDAATLTRDAGEFTRDAGSYRALVRRWVLSDAYARRLSARVPVSNRLFVRALFVDLLDRLPTEGESEPMRQALDGLSDPTPLRALVARMLVESHKIPVPGRAEVADPAAWIRAQFARFLARAPDEAETRAFLAAWNEPACRPQTILCALLGSAEYQTY